MGHIQCPEALHSLFFYLKLIFLPKHLVLSNLLTVSHSLREGKARKSVTYNYACMLVLLVIQTSGDLRMMEHYTTPLLNVCKADENNAKLQG